MRALKAKLEQELRDRAARYGLPRPTRVEVEEWELEDDESPTVLVRAYWKRPSSGWFQIHGHYDKRDGQFKRLYDEASISWDKLPKKMIAPLKSLGVPLSEEPIQGETFQLLSRDARLDQGEFAKRVIAPLLGAPRKNPERDIQPGLFGGEHGQYVPLEDVPYEQLVTLKPQQFSAEEWDELEEGDRKRILANDKKAARAVKDAVRVIVQRYEWAAEGGDAKQDASLYMEGDFEDFLGSAGEGLNMEPPRPMEDYFPSHLIERLSEPFEKDYEKEEIDSALADVLVDNNMYDFDVEDVALYGYRGNAVYWTGVSDQEFSVDLQNDLPAIALKSAGPAAIREVELQVARETGGGIDFDDRNQTSLGKLLSYGEGDWRSILSVSVEANLAVVARLNLERALESIKETLGPPDTEESIAAVEERVVHRFDDGYYVQNLIATELPKEGRVQRMCVGRPEMGYMAAVRNKRTAIWSLRKPSGKPVLTFEIDLDDDGDPENVEQIKGNANRLPGFALGQQYKEDAKFRAHEVEMAIRIVRDVLKLDPDDVSDLRPALSYLRSGPAGRRQVEDVMDVLFRRNNPAGPHCKNYGFDAPSTRERRD